MCPAAGSDVLVSYRMYDIYLSVCLSPEKTLEDLDRSEDRPWTKAPFFQSTSEHLHTLSTMFRNQYDTDVTVWSPEGRLLQVSALRMRKHIRRATKLNLLRCPFPAPPR